MMIPLTTHLAFGGDYSPEQWEESVWVQDVELMKKAGVNLVTIGVWSWAKLEPREGEREWGWLDRLLDLLHSAEISVDLATPTASPPPWLSVNYPQTLPVTSAGVRLNHGSRNHYCPSSPRFRSASLAIATDVAQRYHNHPSVVMWHIGNEFGSVCYCDSCAQGFREWLLERYGDLAGINEAWGTTFWSQTFSDIGQVIPPRDAVYTINPTTQLDWRRFCSDQLRSCYREQYEAIRVFDPHRPITTNFMGFFHKVDYHSWAADIDVAADDIYPNPADTSAPMRAGLAHDLMRSLKQAPWLLMEQTSAAVNWRDHNVPKTTWQMHSEALRAVAHGADAVMYFQWRASRYGSERWHSAMLPHQGEASRIFKSVCELGAQLQELAEITTTHEQGQVALLFDWSNWWALGTQGNPTKELDALELLTQWYEPLWRAGIQVDILPPDAPLADYAVVLAPQLYLVSDDVLANLRRFVQAGGVLGLGPFSAVADTRGHIRPGPYPAMLHDLLGATVAEQIPLPGPLPIQRGSRQLGSTQYYAEHLQVDHGRPWATFGSGAAPSPYLAQPALPGGFAGVVSKDNRLWYLGADADASTLSAWVADVCAAAGLVLKELPIGIEQARRGEFTFTFNHTNEPYQVTFTQPQRLISNPKEVSEQFEVAAESCLITRTHS